ncbi:hypothetical protein LCGC14_2490450 [marine sediment metagenome]|uniref:SWIM-type domain-containing protein n=1 Tax=marine sediment metagenome TaxID=412755 RepID=A0A0F9B5J2_9ZZZZ
MSEGSDAYEQFRCEKWNTTLYSCHCPGYQFRKKCRHIDFLRSKFIKGNGKTNSNPNLTYDKALESVVDGAEATEFVEKYGEDVLDKSKLIGDLFERHGKLYRLE